MKSSVKYDLKTKTELIQNYLSSGLSKKAFAEKHNIKVSTFKGWIYKKGSGAPSHSAGFQSIKLIASQPLGKPMPSQLVGRLLLRQGAMMEITSDMDPDWVSQLLMTLENASC